MRTDRAPPTNTDKRHLKPINVAGQSFESDSKGSELILRRQLLADPIVNAGIRTNAALEIATLSATDGARSPATSGFLSEAFDATLGSTRFTNTVQSGRCVAPAQTGVQRLASKVTGFPPARERRAVICEQFWP
jgi:hypothetical protein